MVQQEQSPLRHSDRSLRKSSKRPFAKTNRKNQRKKTVTIPKKELEKLLDMIRTVSDFVDRRNDPKQVERERIKRETLERGNFQPGLGWTYLNHFEPVVSEEFNRKYERRKEVIRKGTWNPSRKGWEYDGDFANIWD